jgi:hypothetical protein
MDAAVKAGVEAELRGDEGERFRVYADFNGKPIGPGSHVVGEATIAVGRNLSTRGISNAESQMPLDNDCDTAVNDLDSVMPWVHEMTPGRQIVVYSLYFNTALGKESERFGGPPVTRYAQTLHLWRCPTRGIR